MAAANYDACLAKVLKYEGGYTNHPSDPGGPTNWGITIHDARMYWKKDATAADVKGMPLSVAKGIYRLRYWSKMGCDAIPAGPDLCKFDSGVNSGVGRGEKWYAAAKALAPVECVKRMCAIRLSFLHGLRTWGVFGGGWGRRVTDVEATGVKMALQAQGKPAAEVKKQLEAEGAKAKVGAKKDAAKAGGTVAAPTTTQLPDVDFSSKIGLTVVIVIAVAVAAYFIWNFVHNRHRAKAYAAAAAEV